MQPRKTNFYVIAPKAVWESEFKDNAVTPHLKEPRMNEKKDKAVCDAEFTLDKLNALKARGCVVLNHTETLVEMQKKGWRSKEKMLG